MEYKAYDRGLYEQYRVDLAANGTATLPAALASGTYQAGKSIEANGMTVTLKGTPNENDVILVDRVATSSTSKLSVFQVLDQAITAITTQTKDQPGALEHGVAVALAQIDTAMSRVSTVRATAGDLLNQADRKADALQTRSDLMETQRSSAEDIDMVAALSQLKTQQTAVSAALQSYASIQKLSLFDYIR